MALGSLGWELAGTMICEQFGFRIILQMADSFQHLYTEDAILEIPQISRARYACNLLTT